MEETQEVPNQNPITPIPPTATYSTPQPTPTSKTPWMLLSLIVILLGIASYFGYQNYQLKQQLTAQQPTPTASTTVVNSPTPTTSQIPTSDPTDNWKTYVHPDKLYTIKYPSNEFFVREDPIGEKMATVCRTELILVSVKNKSLTTNYGDGNIIIDVCMNPEQSDFPRSIFSNIEGTQSESVVDNKKAYIMNGVANLPKLGIEAKEITRVAVYNQGQYSFDFVGGEKNKVGRELFTQILSTFKFTN